MNQRISKPYDARAVRSREALRAALLRLVAEKPLEQISIQDITGEAGLSYPTFFRQFAAKEQLLEDIAADEIRCLLSLTLPLFEADNRQDSLRAMCNYVGERRALWKSLLTGGAAGAMREEFIRIAEDIGSNMERTGKRANPWLPTDLAGRFVVSGLFEIIAWWLRQPESYPIENVMTFIDALIIRSTVLPANIKLI